MRPTHISLLPHMHRVPAVGRPGSAARGMKPRLPNQHECMPALRPGLLSGYAGGRRRVVGTLTRIGGGETVKKVHTVQLSVRHSYPRVTPLKYTRRHKHEDMKLPRRWQGLQSIFPVDMCVPICSHLCMQVFVMLQSCAWWAQATNKHTPASH